MNETEFKLDENVLINAGIRNLSIKICIYTFDCSFLFCFFHWRWHLANIVVYATFSQFVLLDLVLV